MTNSDGEGTLSALSDNSDDPDVTIPYENASTYRFTIDDHISDLKSVESAAQILRRPSQFQTEVPRLTVSDTKTAAFR